MSSEQIITRSSGNTIESSFRHPDRSHSALHIGHENCCSPWNIEAFFKIFLNDIIAVVDRELKIRWKSIRATLKPKFTIVIMSNSPLRMIGSCRLTNNTLRSLAYAERVDRAVQPVIH